MMSGCLICVSAAEAAERFAADPARDAGAWCVRALVLGTAYGLWSAAGRSTEQAQRALAQTLCRTHHDLAIATAMALEVERSRG
jgi:hypothetical protein